MPMPLLAALPLSPHLLLAPLALLGGAAPLRQHPARRVVLLFGLPGGGPGGSPSRRGSQRGEGLSPASSPGSRSGGSSRSSSPPPGYRQYGGGTPACATTFSANPVFSHDGGGGSLSCGGASTASPGLPRSSARTLIGTPRAALRFGSASVHPEPQEEGSHSLAGAAAAAAAAEAAEALSASAATSPGCSPTRPLLGVARVHPECSPGLRLAPSPVQEPRGLQLILPPPQAAAAVAPGGTGRGSGGGDAGLLAGVLADGELAAAAAACAAAGVECRLAPACAMGRESRMQQPLALAQWLSQRAMPLLCGGGGGACGAAGQQLPVMVAVQAGCEAEGAMAAVAHLMQYRQVSMYHAMVAASQWGIDLHLRPQHMLALQHWAATDGPAAAVPALPSARGTPSAGSGDGWR